MAQQGRMIREEDQYRADVEKRLTAFEARSARVEEKLDQILAVVSAGKIGGEVIKWIGGLALAVAAILGVTHSK